MKVLTEADRYAAWGDPCTANGDVVLVTVQFESTNGLRGIGVNKGALPAFAALATLFRRFGYLLDGADTGSYNCRRIGGGTTSSRPWSAHAWATALDFNWLENPAGSKLIVDPLMDPRIPKAVEALVTKSGDPLYRWGGNWDRDDRTDHTYYDAMHWEVIATPEAIATGIIDPGGILGRLEEELTNDQMTYLIDSIKAETDPDGFNLSTTSKGHTVEWLRATAAEAGIPATDEVALAEWIGRLGDPSDPTSGLLPHDHAGLSDDGNVI